MQTFRCRYATFSYDDEPEHKDTYNDNKVRIENVAKEIDAMPRPNDPDNRIICASIRLSSETALAACIYKRKLFFATFNRERQCLSFDDKTNTLSSKAIPAIPQLARRMENAINRYRKNNEITYFDQKEQKQWEPLIPTMDRLVSLEETIEKQSEERRAAIRTSESYFEEIEKIIGEENRNLTFRNIMLNAPKKELSFEEKIMLHANMTVVEEDRAEKLLNADISHVGYADNLLNQSLSERINEAKAEALAEKNKEKTAEHIRGNEEITI